MDSLLVFVAALAAALAQPDLEFVCYNDANCADLEPRPIFTLADSVQSCCGMPDVVSALEHSPNICTDCGPSTLERISPEYIVLSTPETLTIEIQATGFSGITWIHNGTAMHDFPRLELESFSKRLMVYNTTVSDFGTYEADVHTIGGDVLTTSFVVASYGLPSVTLSHDQPLPGSQFLVVTCTVLGYPPPSITLEPLTPTSNGTTNSMTSSQIIIPLANITEEEVYTCTASNFLPNGTEVTNDESITINPSDFIPMIVSDPLGREFNVTLPTRIEISCTLLSGLPRPVIEWFKDGLPFEEAEGEGRRVLETNGSDVSTLLVEFPTINDRGRYTCIFTNIIGSSSADFMVSVLAPPNVTAWPEEIIVNKFNLGRTVLFICEGFGYPAPMVTWSTFQGELLNGHCNSSNIGGVEGEADYDYSGGQDYDRGTPTIPPFTTEILGEAILTQDTTQPSLPPATTEPTSVEDLRPRECSIMLVAADVGTIQSILTITNANRERSATFVCRGENGVNNFIDSPQTDSVNLTVTASPFYQTQPRRETTTILSLYVEITCVIRDNSELSITWYREVESDNREPVMEAGRMSISTTVQMEELMTVTTVLSISDVQPEDSATYTCQAESQNGIDTASSLLVVRVPANITERPQNIEVQNGENATFICEAVGSPLPIIQWAMLANGNLTYLDSFGGSEIVTTNVATGTIISLLQIESVQEIDEGEYICFTSNGITLSNLTTIVENATAVLSIAEPAVIAATPQSVFTTPGQTVMLACSASGALLPMVTWNYEGTPLTSVCVDPNFCYGEQDLDPESFLDCEFSCSRVGTNATVVLTITGVASRDSGTYTCNAYVGPEIILSTNVTLSIQAEDEPPTILGPSVTRINVTAPEPFVLACTARGVPEPTILWHIDETPLSTSEKYTIDVFSNIDGSLTISFLTVQNTELTDGGQYTCVAMNIVGNESSVFEVTIHTTPTINVTPLSANLTFPGEPAVFTCTGFGSPLPEITWLYEGSPIEGCSSCTDDDEGSACNLSCERPGEYSLSVTLMLVDATPSESGTYSCIVSNELGSVTATASLDVNVFPLVLVQLLGNETQVEELEFITLLCEAYGFPTPEVTWLRNTTVITVDFADDDKHTIVTEVVNDYFVRSILNISEANPNLDQGEYKCRIDNIIVGNLPVIGSANVLVQAIDDCQDVNNPTINRCANNGTCIDEIDGYVCRCTNLFTGVNCLEPVEVVELPRILSDPETQSVLFLQPVSFTCNATGQPPPIFSWFKDGIFVTNTSSPHVMLCYVTITEALPSDRGEYTCIAQNAFGRSNRSAPGLLSLTNVFQYRIRLTECQVLESQNFQDFVTEVSDFIAGRSLYSIDGTIYSASPVPVPSGQPPQDEIIITVVTNSNTLTDITEDLMRTAAIVEVQSRYNCQFTGFERFDGCSVNEFIFNGEYNETVAWPESEIGNALDMLCPCGKLNISMYEERFLNRNCGGTYTYGAEWIGVINNCDYSNYTFPLCGITTLDIPDQFEILADVSTASEEFTALDFAIASTIMQNISGANPTVEDEELQRDFVLIFNQLLQAEGDAIAESQGRYLAASSLLEALLTFAWRVELDENTAAFKEDMLQVNIGEAQTSEFEGQTYRPDFTDQEGMFQEEFEETPLMGASITLPESLFEDLQLSDRNIRILNYALLSDALFVLDNSTQQAMQLNSEEIILGNIIIAASLSASIAVQNLEDPVTIRFNITEALTEMNATNVTCVFWKVPSLDPYGQWSEDGCRLIDIDDDNTVTCECSHLTHFGLLMDINPSPNENAGVEQSLQLIAYIGIILSIVCLIIIIVTYLASRKLRTRVVGQLLVQMCCALMLLYVAFLVAMHGQHYSTFVWFCYATSSVLHYSILVYFMWTVTEAVHLYLKLVKVFGSDINHFVLKTSFINWGVPLAIVALCTGLGIHYNQWAVFINEELFFCRPVEWPFYIGLLVPFGIAYILDWSLFLVIMCSLIKQFRDKNKLSDKNVTHEYKKLVVIAICLSIMFGFGWIFAFIVAIPSPIVSTIAQYLFSIFVGFQGVMIFVLHGLRSPDARNEWKKWFYRVFFCLEKPTDLPTSSITKRSSPKHFRKQYESPTSIHEERKNPLYSNTTAITNLSDYDITDLPDGSEHEFQTLEVTYIEQSSDEEEETVEIDLQDLSKLFPPQDGN